MTYYAIRNAPQCPNGAILFHTEDCRLLTENSEAWVEFDNVQDAATYILQGHAAQQSKVTNASSSIGASASIGTSVTAGDAPCAAAEEKTNGEAVEKEIAIRSSPKKRKRALPQQKKVGEDENEKDGEDAKKRKEARPRKDSPPSEAGDGIRKIGDEHPLQKKLNDHFDSMLDALVQFKAENGHCNVPQGRYGKLSSWVNAQRKQYKWLKDSNPSGKNSSMTAKRMQQLVDVGFEFTLRKWTGRNLFFEEHLDQLKAFRVETQQLEGIIELRTVVATATCKSLTGWIESQLQMEAKRQKGINSTSLTDERHQQIEELGFIFPSTTKTDDHFDERFEELRYYKEEQGDCLVPKVHPGGLGMWVGNQRKRFLRIVETCGGDEEAAASSDEKIRRLKDFGFVFSVRHRRWRKKPEGVD
uniref:Helicase-associated domain-containing protein n=1 Tax=Attheya septentrionalis TaxID=420275 RepID=A0A7S2U9A0_9STRA|mmetsp:Transcript_13387/g.24253  ORF Transcript_13387/g.24253 Transcript_13387/m.24253 type:complete len:415 (+) Transcript_13387:61-1305(+)